MKTFRDLSIEYMREIISEWESNKMFINQVKKPVGSVGSPVMKDELLIRFENEIVGFKCKGVPMMLKMPSKLFFTTSLSNPPFGENYKADGYRLKKHLDSFDHDFSQFVADQIDNCLGTITYNPLIFKNTKMADDSSKAKGILQKYLNAPLEQVGL